MRSQQSVFWIECMIRSSRQNCCSKQLQCSTLAVTASCLVSQEAKDFIPFASSKVLFETISQFCLRSRCGCLIFNRLTSQHRGYHSKNRHPYQYISFFVPCSLIKKSIRLTNSNARTSRNRDTDREVAIIRILTGHDGKLATLRLISIQQTNCSECSSLDILNFYFFKLEDPVEVGFGTLVLECDLEAPSDE